ncbi:putative thiamine transport system permease protein [Modicisalibacter ilicicola DSM 19980]|uniref:Putative thiamine transport system permease protein n=1 Tax=Modicisalibacter ilicicola DSM 19980 TaxID=1121942 RepID=A0A1M4ZV37_9GAMM|nr:ABC transporter permease subunit [Halomonas ilicicola]SHF21940.1 putative thiamine transport system permease protein [Halomonas ilicicola DSM 19980]
MPSGHAVGVRLAPWLAIALLSLPVASGLAGVIAPAFGWLPALGGNALTLVHWQALLQAPGLGRMVQLSYVTGLASALLSLSIVVLFLGAFMHTRLFTAVRRLLSPLLAVPHAAAAIGLAFLLAPSGLLSRSLSPWLTGWQYPPDILFPGDPHGLALIAGLVIKEVPFLLLMSLAALPQCQASERLCMARALGYGPLSAFLKAVLPGLYPLLRLPIYAVIAFASSTVDVALILGPTTPPTLSVAVLRWLNDPDLTMRFMASAGALLQLVVTLAALASWWLAERLVRQLMRGWLENGRRRSGDMLLGGVALSAVSLSVLLILGSLIGLILWSLAAYWPFPQALPQPPTLRNWMGAAAGLGDPLFQAAVIGLAATALSIVLVVGALEAETLHERPIRPGAQLILYLPLLVPPVAFLFGLVMMQVQLGVAPGLSVVILGHAIFVLPYVFLSLAESYRRLDPRWAHLARSLGAGPARVFWRMRLPMLSVPLLTAAAVGFAVSIGQYLPTLLLGAGRISTITTEAVSLASGGDRRLTAVYALWQLALPALGFALALGLPRLLFRRRSGLLTPV